MNERAHVEYFDWLRIIAALSVIFMHTAAGPLRAGINTGWHLLNVCTSLAFTAVPLFFMMSGYLLMTSRKTADISVLLRHRLPRLLEGRFATTLIGFPPFFSSAILRIVRIA